MIRYKKDVLDQMIELSNIETQEEWDSAVLRMRNKAGRIRDNIDLAMSYVEGGCRTIPQPSDAATELALSATPEDFPRDSYGLAQWLDRAFVQAEAKGSGS